MMIQHSDKRPGARPGGLRFFRDSIMRVRFGAPFWFLCWGLMAGLPPASANIATYEFTVTATEGPLTGTSSTGQFSYEDTAFSVPGTFAGAGLLETVSFSWHGTLFTEATVDTGSLTFDAFGNVVGTVFGTHCFGASGCTLTDFGDWVIEITNTFASFVERWSPTDSDTCDTGRFTDDCAGTVSLQQVTDGGGSGSVPEPGTLALLGLGLLGLGFARRSKKY